MLGVNQNVLLSEFAGTHAVRVQQGCLCYLHYFHLGCSLGSLQKSTVVRGNNSSFCYVILMPFRQGMVIKV